MGKANEVGRIVRAARSQGFGVTQTTRGHYLFYTADGTFVCDLSGTPGSDRETINKIQKLRKAGLRYGKG